MTDCLARGSEPGFRGGHRDGAARRFLFGACPLFLVGAIYECMGLVKDVAATRERVHLCDMRARELALFATTMNGQRVTWQDWFLVHHDPALDLLCAIPYGTFVIAVLAAAVFLYFRDYRTMARFGWSWLALNLGAFVAYRLYPAAPPWYFHAHGCVVVPATAASEGPALARVDALLGVRYFAGMYRRSNVVFGAMPSLHCGYALLVVLECWAVFGPKARALSLAFLLSMCFGAVYLDHHWVLDVLAGLLYCALVVAASRLFSARWSAP